MSTMYIDVRAYNGKIWSSVKGGCMSWDYLTAVVYILHFRLCAARKHPVVQSWYFNWGENKLFLHSCVTCPLNMGIIIGRNQTGNIGMGTISCLLQLCILTCQRYRLQAAQCAWNSITLWANICFPTQNSGKCVSSLIPRRWVSKKREWGLFKSVALSLVIPSPTTSWGIPCLFLKSDCKLTCIHTCKLKFTFQKRQGCFDYRVISLFCDLTVTCAQDQFLWLCA